MHDPQQQQYLDVVVAAGFEWMCLPPPPVCGPCGVGRLVASNFILSNSPAYSMRAPNTKRTQTMTQASMAVRPSALGMLVVIVLKMLTRTRKTVTRRVIRPGTMSGGTRKEIHDTMTNIPDGR